MGFFQFQRSQTVQIFEKSQLERVSKGLALCIAIDFINCFIFFALVPQYDAYWLSGFVFLNFIGFYGAYEKCSFCLFLFLVFQLSFLALILLIIVITYLVPGIPNPIESVNGLTVFCTCLKVACNSFLVKTLRREIRESKDIQDKSCPL
jgi:hypothetical protein